MKKKKKINKEIKKKRLVNVMSRKRAPFLDIFGQNKQGSRGFGHSRGKAIVF
jgi:hypothetical protein